MIPHDFKNMKITEPKTRFRDYVIATMLIVSYVGLFYWMFILASNP